MNKEEMDLRDGSTVGNIFSNFINGGHNKGGFVDVITNDHRYLQQESFKIFLDCICSWARDYENGKYDARNEWACAISKQIVESLDI